MEKEILNKMPRCQGENCLPHCPCDCHLPDEKLDKKVLYADWYKKGQDDTVATIMEWAKEIQERSDDVHYMFDNEKMVIIKDDLIEFLKSI